MNALEDISRWPMPDYHEHDQPCFLFLITPPFSGSTALASFLNTGPYTTFLEKRAEGQWLVPGLCESDRWSPTKSVNYLSVKAVWLNRYQEIKSATNGEVNVVIEKSPPNMMRIEKLAEQFRAVTFLAMNRNPFANCSSILYRQYDVINLSAADRLQIVQDLARRWLMRTRVLTLLTHKLKVPTVSYERFCESPKAVLSHLTLPQHVIASIKFDPVIKVKDYEPQKISNQNSQQIGRLTSEERKVIREVLKDDEELVVSSGYHIAAD